MLSEVLCDQLAAIVGAANVRTDAVDFSRFGVDRTSQWQAAPCAVVLPASTEEVAAIVALANREQLAIVPSGGRTGLSGGAVACKGELVVALDRMNKVIDFNAIEQTVTCEAGMITQNLQNFAVEKGLFYPVDFASSGSSQIGGNIATNAGGIKVIRYGMTRDWVLGLKVVTGNGDVLDLNQGLVKNNSGYDFRHLFIGSEGTLGLVTECTIKLARPPRDMSVLVLGVESFGAIMDVLKTFNGAMALTAFEFFSEQALQKVQAHSDLPRPFETVTPFYALLEFEGTSDEELELPMTLFETCVEQGWVLDGVISQSLSQAENLWRLREDISEATSFYKPYKNDISVPVSRMPAFLHEVSELVAEAYPDYVIVWFGHIGDGNLHLNILKPESLEQAEFVRHCGNISHQVGQLVKQHGGSISAEHGIGLAKKDYLQYTRSAVEVDLMRQVKRVFDPNGIMNPGKIFDL